MYDIHNVYDPFPGDTKEHRERLQQKLAEYQLKMRAVFPRLRDVIENKNRDLDSVYNAVRPCYETMSFLPMREDDLPILEHFYRRILEVAGPHHIQIQEILLRLIGATASPISSPFLQEMWRYSRIRDQFGPDRRQLALWGLARIAVWHNLPEAYAVLPEGLDDHHADVRYTAVDLNLNAYLMAGKKVPLKIKQKLHKMAKSDPDEDVRYFAKRCLQEPWAREV